MKRALLLSALALAGMQAQANWTLDDSASSLSFVSVKKQHIAEAHQFDSFNGSLDKDGNASINIDLASVNTGIGIRDERMREFLFDTASFAQAKITTQVDMSRIANMQNGTITQMNLTVNIDLHGRQKQQAVVFDVLKVSDDMVLVNTPKPMMINASDFDLTGGIDKLRELAGLPVISYAVPVNATLLFKNKS